MKRLLPLLAVLALVAAACGDSSSSTTAAPTTAPPATAAPTTAAPTTAAPTTAAPTTAPTTTAPPPSTTAPWVYTITMDGSSPAFPGVLGGPNDPNGSGCSPPGNVLPDGIWFGFAEGVSGGVITFDLACYFTGAAALAASGPDCDTEFGDYCVRNVNPKTFSVPIAADAQVWYIPSGSGFPVPVAVGGWPVSGSYLACPGTQCGVWLYVNSGNATGIVEQYEE